jgi:3-(3-hydroxy-phenyl)propionate hydroxylase
VNNSIGGMGLNGGLQDAANLGEKLAAVLTEWADESLLDLYDLQRRTVSVEFVQAQTIANKKRLEEKDPEQRRKNLMELRQTAADPAKAKAFLMRSAMITMQRRAASITLAES